MGIRLCKRASNETRINREITSQLETAKSANTNVQKLLLLGAAECGKSTILKQMRILHDSGFSRDEVEVQRAIVYQNTVQGMLTLIEAREQLGIAGTTSDIEWHAGVIRIWARSDMRSEPFSNMVYTALKCLWADSSIQMCFKRRNEFQFSDSVKGFFDQLDRLAAPDYTPSDQDILYTRAPTTGVSGVKFFIRGITFRVFDVGGQRSERRKWIHHFDDVSAIIFLAAISEFDQVLAEDGKTNRLHEAVHLFDNICNSTVFLPTVSIILFLNKLDLFVEKLKTTSIRTAYPDYKGNNQSPNCIKYIHDQFLKQKTSPTKVIYAHVTCATDTTQINSVLDNVIDTLYLPLTLVGDNLTMGLLVSRDLQQQRKQNTIIENSILVAASAERRTQKLLLLGAAECGKSTILKQMRILHDNGFTMEEVEIQKEIVYQNIVQGMMAIIDARGRLGIVPSTLESDVL